MPIISYNLQKPRAFYNVMHERGGGGSCYINAALQALLSPSLFKRILTQKWCEIDNSLREQLIATCQRRRGFGNFGEQVSELNRHEERLAAMLCVAHTAPRIEPARPYLFTDPFYVGQQDDAAAFIANLLHPEQVPSLSDILHGHMNQSLICTNADCKLARPSEGEAFASMQLPLLTMDGTSLRSVQEAVDAYMPDETVTLEEYCLRCGSTTFTKTHKIIAFPRVLLVYLNRWAGHHVEDAILHSIDANRTLNVQGHNYQLCAAVCHLGPSPHAGHYITVARHATNHGLWWLYDDDQRVLARDEQVSTLCDYGLLGPMQCYVLFYER